MSSLRSKSDAKAVWVGVVLLAECVVVERHHDAKDDEEYWPFEGEDWEDEYVGGEGLR